MKRHVLAAATAVLALSLAACGSGGGKRSTVAATDDGPKTSVLAIGGPGTEGDGIPNRLQNAWPYRVFHDALPRATTFVNGALDDGTAANALQQQVPLASELKPDVVEVWLGADDINAGTDPGAFATNLTAVIDKLRSDGAKRILVADLPFAYGPKVPAFNDAIHRVVSTTHAELVALERANVTLTTSSGAPGPDAASHGVIAAAFGKQVTHR